MTLVKTDRWSTHLLTRSDEEVLNFLQTDVELMLNCHPSPNARAYYDATMAEARKRGLIT